MKKKILVWPRSQLIFFCITKFLKEEYDSELSFMIDDNHISKEFYSKQKFVPIKNLLFLNDYIFDKQKEPDIEYLKNFEIEIEKENKKIFVCTYENTIPIKKNFLK